MTDRKKPGVAFWATVVVVVGMGAAIAFNPDTSGSTLLGIGGTAYAAFWVWAVVRIINCRDRLAIHLAALVGSITVVAAASFGLLLYWASRE
jgi:hypothetical protein